MPYTVRFSLRAKTVKIVSLLLIRLLPFTAKATFPHKGRLTQSVIKQKFEAVKLADKHQFPTQKEKNPPRTIDTRELFVII
jgi:hypothetical protein